MSAGEILLELKGICKTFGATRALHQVNLTVRRGEVHALIGENGAGKSTLMKILSGAYQADAGSILLNGKPAVIGSPAAGRRMGVAMIYQELNLAPHLTVEENLTLGAEKSTAGFVRNQRDAIKKALELMGHPNLPLNVPVRALSISLQQIVEIARALVMNASVVIMDEPTSSLTAADTRALFGLIQRLKENGIAVIYISHFLEEVREISDSYTVIRDGETVGSGAMADVTIPGIIEMMVGRKLNDMFPKIEHRQGETLMKVDGLKGAAMPRGVSFELRRGEILGIAGLVGSGRSETIRGLFGLNRAKGGTLTLRGNQVVEASSLFPRRAIELGIDLLSEDRKEEGLAVNMSITANCTLSSLPRFASLNGWGPLSLGKESLGVTQWIRDLGIRCQGPAQPVVGLSGGNQQKVALARILERKCDIILLDEPTRGVDVGSKVEIYRMIGNLAAQGKAVIFVSSYLPELMGVCDTLAVMHRGHISAVKPVTDWTEHDIMLYATSGN